MQQPRYISKKFKRVRSVKHGVLVCNQIQNVFALYLDREQNRSVFESLKKVGCFHTRWCDSVDISTNKYKNAISEPRRP